MSPNGESGSDREIIAVLAEATSRIMIETGDSFSVALGKAKTGLKEYIKLRVETAKQLVAEGYDEDHAIKRSRELVAFAMKVKG